jgi:hypothetical protein
MYIVYEYAAYGLAVTVGATILFTAYMMSLILVEAGRAIFRLRDGRLAAPRQTDGG